MPNKVYECLFLLDTTKVAGDMASADKQVRALLEKHHAEVLVSRPWDERRLSYPIKNHKKGLFYLTYFASEGKNLAEIERDCALNEMIIRQMILRLPDKLVDTMLAVAKGEHAVALHNIHEEPTENGAVGAPVGGGGDEPPPKPRKPRPEKVDKE